MLQLSSSSVWHIASAFTNKVRTLPPLSSGQMLRLTLPLLVVSRIPHMSPKSIFRGRRPNMEISSTLACLPSLRPIVSMVADRLACGRKPKSQHKHRTAFPPNMLPQRYQLKRPWAQNTNHMLGVRDSVPPATYDPSPRDLEAVELLMPELQDSRPRTQRTLQETPELEPPVTKLDSTNSYSLSR